MHIVKKEMQTDTENKSNMDMVKTYTATIYVGFKETKTGEIRDISIAKKICQDYCDAVGLCVTIKPTEFIYTNGSEPGCEIGLINYPRFPAKWYTIMENAMKIAEQLKESYKQCRVTIVTPEETVMLSEKTGESNG